MKTLLRYYFALLPIFRSDKGNDIILLLTLYHILVNKSSRYFTCG